MGIKDRYLAVAAEIHRVLGEILPELWAAEDSTLLNITSVQVSPDLSEAFVYFCFWPQERVKENTIKLHHLTKEIRKELAEHMVLRKVPKILWRYDIKQDRTHAILDLLDEVKKQDS